MNTNFFMRHFCCYEWETDVNNVKKKKIKHSMSLKSCCSRHLFFSLVFFLSHTIRFLFDLIKQYYSAFTRKFIYMLKAS